ncbi:MAG: cell division protein ZapA [Acidobacteriota bacterium]|nr:MAG: cell division protein ZapA [Acidobacteriota bacterium]
MEQGSEPVTRVRIYNQFYDFRGSDPERIRRLAAYLDGKMSEISDLTPTVDTAKVAILAAMNIVDEYLTANEELSQLSERSSSQEDEILSRLNELVKDPSS